MKRILVAVCSAVVAFQAVAESNRTEIHKAVVGVAQAGGELKGVPFADVIHATTGKRILPFDSKNEADRELLAKIGSALYEVLKRMNATNSAAQSERRINEVTSHL